MAHKKKLSIIIPVYNEKRSLSQLYQELLEQINQYDYEVIFVDDGSKDGSIEVIYDLKEKNDRIKVFMLRRNIGKSMALNIGFQKAIGDIIITMDADLQDDPKEIPNFIEKINEGYDIVNGWKIDRKDPLEKRFPSKLFNKMVSLMSGIKLHDFNCGFKAYRKEVVKTIKVYGEMHRFIPVLAYEYGFISTEIPVKHHKRVHGESKFGFERYFRGFFDFLSLYFLIRYSRKPLHFIGTTSMINLILAVLLIGYTGIMKFYYGQTGVRPALFVGLFFLSAALQIFMTGFVAELLIHNFQKNVDDQLYLKN
ncbi:glycosyltransferase family 2 protein [Thermodesulfobacteriota bacterium]